MKERSWCGAWSRGAQPPACFCAILAATLCSATLLHGQSLPDAPSALLGYVVQTSAPQSISPPPSPKPLLPPCEQVEQRPKFSFPKFGKSTSSLYPAGTLCQGEDPFQPIVSTSRLPLTPAQKGALAVNNIENPFNLLTIVGFSAINIAANSHTAYGPGFPGFGKLVGYSFVEDAQSEFFGTFLIPSLAHEDPRYHRLPGRPVARRILHAVGHTFVSQHDDGSPMLNYATLLTYPISAELGNLYVPGIGVNAPSTAKRVAADIATDPVGAVVAEFLPDIAKRIHIRVVFAQRILQQVATSSQNQ